MPDNPQAEHQIQPNTAKQEPLEVIQNEKDCDVFFYSGPIEDESVERFWAIVEEKKRRPNVALILTTYGGSADAAYKIASRLRTAYKKFTLYVFGPCKSAGTLIACGAHEIIMSIRGELGPLDVQIAKRDELLGRASGLEVSRALDFVSTQSFEMFESHFLRLIEKSMGQISTKTASEIAKTITVGLLSPITQQIDPMQLGEIQRAMNVAFEYGKMLEMEPNVLRRLVTFYPSHGFVIDLEEAKTLFRNVSEPSLVEKQFETDLTTAIIEMLEGNFILSQATKFTFITLEHEPANPHSEQTRAAPEVAATSDPSGANGNSGGTSVNRDKKRKPTASKSDQRSARHGLRLVR